MATKKKAAKKASGKSKILTADLRRVFRFDPETGRTELMAANLEEWAATILKEHSVETGWKVAHDWQVQNGPLKPGERLLPKVPFCLQGAFDVENLYAYDSLKGMNLRADFYQQTRTLPPGTKVMIKVP